MEARDGSAGGEVDPKGICVCASFEICCVYMSVFKFTQMPDTVHLPSRCILMRHYEILIMMTAKKEIKTFMMIIAVIIMTDSK